MAAQQAASRSAGPSPTFGSSGGAVPSATAIRNNNGSFAFKDASGNPISAAAYAAAKNIPFRKVLEQMATAGDGGAKAALGFVGDDYGYDSRKIGNNVGLYNALTWGVKPGAARGASGSW